MNRTNYTEIIQEVYNQIIPRKLDEAYKELIENIKKYNNLVINEIFLEENSISNTVNNLKETREEISTSDDKKLLEEARNNILKALNSQNSMEVDFETITRLSSLCEKLQKKIQTREKNNQLYEEQYIRRNVKFDKYLKTLAEIIDSIKNNLETIRALDITDEKRIDGLKITDKHLSLLDNISSVKIGEFSDEQKQLLKTNLVSYIKMRISAFKKAEQLAPIVIKYYNERASRPDSFDYHGNPYLNDYRLIKDAIYKITDRDIAYAFEFINTSKEVPEYIKNIESMNLTMQSIESFLTTGALLPESDQLFKFNIDNLSHVEVVDNLYSINNNKKKSQSK